VLQLLIYRLSYGTLIEWYVFVMHFDSQKVKWFWS